MKLVIVLFALYTFIESISYGLYEYQTKENKAGGISIFIIATIRINSTDI